MLRITQAFLSHLFLFSFPFCPLGVFFSWQINLICLFRQRIYSGKEYILAESRQLSVTELQEWRLGGSQQWGCELARGEVLAGCLAWECFQGSERCRGAFRRTGEAFLAISDAECQVNKQMSTTGQKSSLPAGLSQAAQISAVSWLVSAVPG